MNLAPPDGLPDRSVPPAYDALLEPDGTITASEMSYREFYRDPELNAIIAQALAQNRDLMIATARIEQARARFRIEDSNRLPNAVATGSVVRTRQALLDDGAAVGAAEDGAQQSNSVTSTRYDIGVGVSSFELDFWGRLRNLSDAARAEYLSSVAAQQAFYLSLVADTATTYFDIVETNEQIELAEATAVSRRDGLRIARLRLDAGVTSALPFRQAESLLTQAEQQLSAEKLVLAQLRNQLSVLVGNAVPSAIGEGASLADFNDDRRIFAGATSELLLARPDILAAEETLRGARANIGAARAAFFPSISLTGSAGLASSDRGGLFGSDGFGWSFGPTISLPIFDAGARLADLNLAEALETEQVANYQLTIQNAFREVSDALAGRKYLAEQIEVLNRAVSAQERIARIARLRYREGVADYLEVLDAERNLFAAQQQLLEVNRLWLQNRTTLFVALGGGIGSPSRTD
ncbi:MAG: efflux transporter outer membrane subunit [Alteraurantiacibacter sp.]